MLYPGFFMHKCTHAVSLFSTLDGTLRLELHKGTSILSTRAQIKNYLPRTVQIIQVVMVGGEDLADRVKSKTLKEGDADKLRKIAKMLIGEAIARNFDFHRILDFITLKGEFSEQR